MPPHCWVPGCPAGNARTKDPSLTLFSFPCDKETREKWLLALPSRDWSDLDNAKVCEKHFLVDLLLSIQDGDEMDVQRLAEGAVPSVFTVTPADSAKDVRMRKKRLRAIGPMKMVHGELSLAQPCCVIGCDSNAPSRKRASPIVPVFCFPKNMAVNRKWMSVIWRKGWQPNDSSVVCGLHFQPDDFITTRKIFMDDGSAAVKPLAVPRLKVTAVPSRFSDQSEAMRSYVERHEELIEDESTAERDDDRLSAFPSQDGRVNKENAYFDTLDVREPRFEKKMADRQRSKPRQSERKKQKSRRMKQSDEYALTSKRISKRQKIENTKCGSDYILPDCGYANLDSGSLDLCGLPAPFLIKTEESPHVYSGVEEFTDSWKKSAVHGQSVPYVMMQKTVTSSTVRVEQLAEKTDVFKSDHDYALSANKVRFRAAESDQMADHHFEEVIIESLIGEIKQETEDIVSDNNIHIFDTVNPPMVDVGSDVWISSDVNELRCVEVQSGAAECDVVETDVLESNTVESDAVESNATKSSVVVRNVVSGDVADGNASDESDFVNAFLECPARFDGSPASSVDGFIECVDIFRKANVIRQPEALRDFHILLQEDAAVWWRGRRSKVTSWSRALAAMRSEFGSKRSADEVYRSIVRSVRGESESHASFVERVLKLFSELPYPGKSIMKLDMIYALLDDDVRELVPRSRLESAQDLFDCLRSFDKNFKRADKVISSRKRGTNHTYRNFVNVVKCFQCKVMRQKQSELQAELDNSAAKECVTCYKRGLCETNKIKLPCHYCKKLGDKLVALQEEYLLSVKLLEGRNIEDGNDIVDMRCTSCCVLRDELAQKSKTCKCCLRINADIDDSLTKTVVRANNASYIESNSKMQEKCAQMETEGVAMTKCKCCDKSSIDERDDESLLTKTCLRCLPLRRFQIKHGKHGLKRSYTKSNKKLLKNNDSILMKAIQMANINTESKIESDYLLIGDYFSDAAIESPLRARPASVSDSLTVGNSGYRTKPKLDVPLPVSFSLPGITIKPIMKGAAPIVRIRNGDKRKSGKLSTKSAKKTAEKNIKKRSAIDRSKMNLFIRIVVNDSMNILAMLDPLAKNNFLSEKLFEVLVKTNYEFIELPATVSVHSKNSEVQSVLSTVVSVDIQGKRLETPFWYVEGVDDKTRLGEEFIRDAGLVMDREREVWYFKNVPHESYPLEMKP